MVIPNQLSTEEFNCQDCAAPFQRATMIFTKKLPLDRRTRFCEKCLKRRGFESEEADIMEKIDSKWKETCPPLYRDTDPSRLHPTLQQMAEQWQRGPRGVGFVGYAGCGKTRAAFLIVKRMIQAERSVMAVSAVKFSKLSADQFCDDRGERAEVRRTLDRFHRADVLLIDDLGKERMTERTQTEMFELLEHRTSHLLPTIWTANASGNELLQMFSQDRGEPILRRLSEFSEVVIVK